jgi:hypothetical protein
MIILNLTQLIANIVFSTFTAVVIIIYSIIIFGLTAKTLNI